jgi:hypothetical protein
LQSFQIQPLLSRLAELSLRGHSSRSKSLCLWGERARSLMWRGFWHFPANFFSGRGDRWPRPPSVAPSLFRRAFCRFRPHSTEFRGDSPGFPRRTHAGKLVSQSRCDHSRGRFSWWNHRPYAAGSRSTHLTGPAEPETPVYPRRSEQHAPMCNAVATITDVLNARVRHGQVALDERPARPRSPDGFYGFNQLHVASSVLIRLPRVSVTKNPSVTSHQGVWDTHTRPLSNLSRTRAHPYVYENK